MCSGEGAGEGAGEGEGRGRKIMRLLVIPLDAVVIVGEAIVGEAYLTQRLGVVVRSWLVALF
jgi:hypothetical protein